MPLTGIDRVGMMPGMQAPRNVTDRSKNPPRLLIYGNSWGLLELPKLPRKGDAWTLEQTLDKLVEAGFQGFQGNTTDADKVRKRGLRYAAGGRINAPAEAEPAVKQAADVKADCM